MCQIAQQCTDMFTILGSLLSLRNALHRTATNRADSDISILACGMSCHPDKAVVQTQAHAL